MSFGGGGDVLSILRNGALFHIGAFNKYTLLTSSSFIHSLNTIRCIIECALNVRVLCCLSRCLPHIQWHPFIYYAPRIRQRGDPIRQQRLYETRRVCLILYVGCVWVFRDLMLLFRDASPKDVCKTR